MIAVVELEDTVERLKAENNIEAAVSILYDAISLHARGKDFTRAESLREKLMEVDPFAISEIVSSAEIIEQEKRKNLSKNHLSLWSDLYKSLSRDEGNALYHSLKEAAFQTDEMVFAQGDRNANLYFVRQGRLKMFYSAGTREIFLKTLQPGDIFGIESYFKDSVCTISVSPFHQVKLHFLEKSVLKEWKEKFPLLEHKLLGYCHKFEKPYDILTKKGVERRVHKRFNIDGNAVFQLLNDSGAPLAKPLSCGIVDISASGIACRIFLAKKEIGNLLLGRKITLKIHLRIDSVFNSFNRTGTIVAVSSPPVKEYYMHIKFDEPLDKSLMTELASISRCL